MLSGRIKKWLRKRKQSQRINQQILLMLQHLDRKLSLIQQELIAMKKPNSEEIEIKL